MSKPWRRLRKFLWPSQKSWTLTFKVHMNFCLYKYSNLPKCKFDHWSKMDLNLTKLSRRPTIIICSKFFDYQVFFVFLSKMCWILLKLIFVKYYWIKEWVEKSNFICDTFWLFKSLLYFVTKIALTYCQKKNVLVIEKNFGNSRLKALEQFIQTVKGQNNFW